MKHFFGYRMVLLIKVNTRLGHSNQVLPSVSLEGVKSFSNFNHQYVSMKVINRENFSPTLFLLQFLGTV